MVFGKKNYSDSERAEHGLSPGLPNGTLQSTPSPDFPGRFPSTVAIHLVTLAITPWCYLNFQCFDENRLFWRGGGLIGYLNLTI